MKHEDLKVGMKVKRIGWNNPLLYTSTLGNVSTVSFIDNEDGGVGFSTSEDQGRYFSAEYFEAVEDIKEKETMQDTNKNLITMDKKYRTRCGYPVRVLCIDRKDSMFPVIAVYEENGFEVVAYCNSKGLSTTEERLDLIEVSPYEDFKKDDKVMVRNQEDEEGYWLACHFSHVEEGKACCFTEGTTSWTAGCYDLALWDYCRKPTQEELGE